VHSPQPAENEIWVAPLGRSRSALIFAVLLASRAAGTFWRALNAGLPQLALLWADLACTRAPWGLCAAMLGFLAGSQGLQSQAALLDRHT